MVDAGHKHSCWAAPVDVQAWGSGWTRAGSVRSLVARLDPITDDNVITHLSFEVLTPVSAAHIGYAAAAAKTCAVPRVAERILNGGDGKQVRNPVKRDADTLAYFSDLFAMGHRSAEGRAACQKLGEMHQRMNIRNDDQLYTLGLLIFGPQQLAATYGTRVHSATEIDAAFSFWRGVGEQMALHDIPTSPSAYQLWMTAYENQHFEPSEDGHRAAEAHVRGLSVRFPGFALRLARAAVVETMDDRTRICLGYRPVARPVAGALRLSWQAITAAEPLRLVRCDHTWARSRR